MAYNYSRDINPGGFRLQWRNDKGPIAKVNI
jgi:hypothetical protein